MTEACTTALTMASWVQIVRTTFIRSQHKTLEESKIPMVAKFCNSNCGFADVDKTEYILLSTTSQAQRLYIFNSIMSITIEACKWYAIHRDEWYNWDDVVALASYVKEQAPDRAMELPPVLRPAEDGNDNLVEIKDQLVKIMYEVSSMAAKYGYNEENIARAAIDTIKLAYEHHGGEQPHGD